MANLRVDNLCGTGGRNAIDGSLYFGGDNDPAGLTIADTTDLELGSETNWTIEFWVKLNHGALSDWDVIMGKGSNDNGGTEYEWFVEVMAANHLVFLSTTAGSAWDFNQQITPVLVIGEWYHVAIVRNGSGSNTLKSYVNGVQYSSHTSQNIYTGNDEFGIGHFAHTKGLNSDVTLSNVRIVKGTSVYTAAFTPPTEKLTVVENTVLLCCQDSDDPTQEATGKTITGFGGLQTFDDTNILTNGGFTSDLSGWTVAQGTIAWNAGKAHMTGTSGNSLEQNVTTVVGKRYRLTATVDNTSNSGNNAGITLGSIQVYVASSTIQSASRTFHADFTATSTSTLVDLWGGTAVTGYWSDATVKLIDPPKAPKDLPSVGVDAGVTFDGDTKVNTQSYMYFPTGDTSQRGRGRAVSWWGIYNTSGNYTKDVDYFDIQSLGTTTKFGEISDTVGLGAGMSSSTRGVFAGGTKPGVGNMNLLEYITIATTGNAKDFGGVSTTFRYGAGISNQTRGLIAGAYQGSGASGTLNTIQYITIANLGDTLDFGDMVADGGTGVQGMGSCSSPTRGITFGGGTPSKINEMNYITIMSTGNSVDFGDLSDTRYLCQGVSSSTRGVIGGGDNSGAVNIIEYITIATTGNATDFGDLMSAREHSGSEGGSNGIRGVFVGGGDWPAGNNTMEYITIATTGNTKDFGDSRTAISAPYGSTTVSDCHGGLS